MKAYLQRAKKVQKRIQILASCSDDEHCLSRIFGTKSFLECSNQILEWMQGAGLQTHIDSIGNIRGKLLSTNPGAKTLVIGSHFDTVINAGKYDGPLGILAGLDLVENIVAHKISLPFNIEIIAFSEEEGVRFHTTYLGSKVIAGCFDNNLLDKKDEQGITLLQALESMKYNSSLLSASAIPPQEWLGYFEIHIEQGPVLYEKNIPVGIVTSIAGQKRIEINFRGNPGHAGTVPMNMRSDALCAAAQFILAVEEFAAHEKKKLVATVGKIHVENAASNVIPGSVICSLDIRSADGEILSDAYERIHKLCEKICHKRKIYFEWNLIQESDPVICDKKLKKLLSGSIKEKNIELIKLTSGAGHDAVVISKIAPVAMLFIKCFKGISHNPLENVEIEDIATALEVSDNFIQQLAGKAIAAEPAY